MEAILTLALAFVGQWLKRFAGDNRYVLNALVFFVALVAVLVWSYAQHNPSFMQVLVEAGKALLLAVGWYEILLKRLGAKSLREVQLGTDTQ